MSEGGGTNSVAGRQTPPTPRVIADELRSQGSVLAFCLLLAGAIFAFDLMFPLGVAAAVLYIAVILISTTLPRRRHVVGLAILCTVLTLLAFQLSPPGGELWKVAANRGLALCAIWVTLLLSLMHRRGEQEIRRSEQRKSAILDSALHAIITTDEYGRIADFNPAAEWLFGYSAEEALGMDFEPLLLLDSGVEWDIRGLASRRESRDGYVFEHRADARAVRADGTQISVEISLTTATVEGCRLFTAHVTDMTQQNEITAQNARLSAAIEQTSEAVLITDINGVTQYVNPAFEHITGYSRAEALGRKPSIVKSGKHSQAQYKELWTTILAGEPWSGVITNRKKNGSLYEEEMTITPVRDLRGHITNFVAVKRDTTRERALEKELRHAQKMEAIGTLAGGIAHDFNNILFAIRGFTDLASGSLAEEAPTVAAVEYIDEISKAEKRAAQLVRHMLTFSRHSDPVREPQCLEPIFTEALKLLRASVPSIIEFEHNLNPNCGPVMADASQMHQLLLNLVTNAYHAMKDEGGTLTVGFDDMTVDLETADSQVNLDASNYVKLSVSDTGDGMDEATLARIFEPFFTTKEVGQGTGLGLSTVHGIVKSHGGIITVNSELAKGTTFEIYLPKCAPELCASSNANEDSEAPRGKESILLVDDETQIVNLSKNALQRLGYTVTATDHSPDALETFRERPDSFDLLITDLTMPKMNGLELARQVRRLKPELPVILCTGYSDGYEKIISESPHISKVIKKPADSLEIARAVRNALDQRNAQAV